MKKLQSIGICFFLILTLALTCKVHAEADAIEITVGSVVQANITENGGYVYFSFVPDETSTYRFYSLSGEDTYGYLYDADMNMIISDDDSGDGNNFAIKYSLEKDTQYYYGVRYYSSDRTGMIDVCLAGENDNNLTVDALGDTYRYIYIGGSTDLGVQAACDTGTLRYGWRCYVTEENQWITLENEASSTLSLTDIREPAQYRCIAIDEYGNGKYVDFEIRIDNKLVAGPKDNEWEVYAEKGGSVTLEVAASCLDGELFYQWRKNGEEIEGASSSTYTVENVLEPSSYDCTVKDEFGNSRYVGFEVRIQNHFTTNAVGETNRSVAPGDSFTLEVQASCDDGVLDYEWSAYFEKEGRWEILSDVKSPTCNVDDIQQSMRYSCRVSDEYGNNQTISFTIQIDNDFTARINDEDSTVYTEPGGSVTLEVIASCREGEISYQWDGPSGELSGANGPSYVVDNVQSDTQGWYGCRVSDQYGNETYVSVVVRIQNHFDVKAVGETDRRISIGESTTLEVEASCDNGNLHYEWTAYTITDDREKALTDANTNTYTVENLEQSMEYKCRVYDDFGNYKSIYFSLWIDNEFVADAKDGIRNITIEPGETATLEVEASCKNGGLNYEWYGENGLIADASSASYITDTINKATSYRCLVKDVYGNSSFVYFYITIENHLVAEPIGQTRRKVSAGDTVEMEVEVSCDKGEVHFEWYVEKSHDGFNLIDGATSSAYTAENLQQATEYQCYIWDDYGNNRYIYFDITIDNDFLAEAKDGKWDVTVEQGESVTLEVAASCREGDLKYQWYGEQGLIAGATTASYTVNNVENSTSAYRCYVCDSYGNYTYIHFSILIENHFVVNAVGYTDRRVAIGGSVTMEVEASCEKGSISYEWNAYYRKEGKWERLANATSASYTAVDIQQMMMYECVVRDEYGSTKSVNFRVYIDNELKVVPVERNYYTVELGSDITLRVNATCSQGELTYTWRKQAYDEENGHYYEEIQTDNSDTLVLSDIQNAGHYLCTVTDEYDNNMTIHFTIAIDSGLMATYVGEREYTVNPGASVTLGVKASVNSGDLTYRWTCEEYRNGSHYETTFDEDSPSLTVNDIQYAADYYCTVRDEFANERGVRFSIFIENGLSVEAESNTVFYIHNGDSVTMSVKASCNSGDLQYAWDGYWWNDSYTIPLNIPRDTGNTFTLTNAQIGTECFCVVSDKYGNKKELHFQMKEFTERSAFVRIKTGQTVMLPVTEESGTLLSTVIEEGASASVSGSRVTALSNGITRVKAEYQNYTQTFTIVVYEDTGTLMLPAGLTTIEAEAFAGNANNNRFVELGSSVTYVGQDAFQDYSILQLVVPSAATTFADRIFFEADPTIICPQGSAAEAYARKHNISYVYPG